MCIRDRVSTQSTGFQTQQDGSMSAAENDGTLALRATINEALASFSDQTALFCAERLYAETRAAEDLRLLCTCYMRMGQEARAYRLLKLHRNASTPTHPQNLFLLAKVCFQLKHFDEAEAVLTGAPRSAQRAEFDAGRAELPNGSYGLELLGEICRRTGRSGKAVEYFTQAVQLNPAHWSAFQALCDLGGGASAEAMSAMPSIQGAVQRLHADATPDVSRGLFADSPAGSLLFTPGSGYAPSPAHSTPFNEGPRVPPPVVPRARPSRGSDHVSTRGSSLFSETRQTRSRTAAGSDWFRTLSRAYAMLSQYMLPNVLEEVDSLEAQHANTPWCLALQGRAHFEMTNYKLAAKSFKAALALDPLCTEAIDVYSTTLWQLKLELDLSQLAQEVIQDNRRCPQAWCVLGNCFSLQQDHDSAIKFFDRAVQLDPYYSTAYTLCGHEQAANEEHDKSLSYYRNAIRHDERNYKAWFGLGTVYQRQEKHEAAELHFLHAIEIHPGSSVLHCWLGIVRDEAHAYQSALQSLETAIELNPKNPIARFKRAKVLMQLDHTAEAVDELLELQAVEPKEAELYLQLGRAYKKLGEHHSARLQLMLAWDLDPKNSNRIKAEMEQLDNPGLDLDGV
eukprot:TRINITY_DN3441_c0_g1_i1.p1 TRINITY_DN3441_c0_g1~~TRINITY_DN3441_c0_g1_i1.p1  ORF type:complete len:622 (+),score=153.87 TRINITY_DN3441_c0_g1_i1:166-2031(+)